MTKPRGITFHFFGGIEKLFLFFAINQSRHRVTGLYGISWSKGFIGYMSTAPAPLKGDVE